MIYNATINQSDTVEGKEGQGRDIGDVSNQGGNSKGFNNGDIDRKREMASMRGARVGPHK